MHWALDPVWKICNFLWIQCCASISAERWGLQPKSCNHLDPENQAVLTGANVLMKIVPFTFTFIWSIIPYTFTFSITPSVLNVQCAFLHSKRSGKNCQIQSPFSSLSLKSKRIWTLSFRHDIYGILYLDHGGVWEAEPQYVHLWGLWVNVQCTMQVIWGYSVHMYHAGYLGHNRVWDTVCQGTSQQHQHQPDLQSCITQECSRFFSPQFTINLWRY